MEQWYLHNLDSRAPSKGEQEFGRFYKGGQFLPFYIPREFMPQVDESSYPDLLDFAASRGVSWTRRNVAPDQVKPHQRVAWDKARALNPEILAKPILISREPYILDGNHRWAAHKSRESSIEALCFDLSFLDGIAFLFSFPKAYAYGDGNFHPESH